MDHVIDIPSAPLVLIPLGTSTDYVTNDTIQLAVTPGSPVAPRAYCLHLP